jgi:2'-5' RNA ligase
MEKLTQKWAIISLLEDVHEGAEFYYTDFPLHVTLAGVFRIDKDGAWLVNELTRILGTQESFSIQTEVKDIFGPNKDIEVMKVTKSTELMDLYKQIFAWLEMSGAVFNAPEYQGKGYLPHVTFQNSSILQPNESKHIKSVSLIDLYPNSDGYQRKIFKTIDIL